MAETTQDTHALTATEAEEGKYGDGDFLDVPVDTDPFDGVAGHTKSFEVDGDVLFSTFQGEVEAALGTEVRLARVEDILFVNADVEFDGRKVRGALTSHDPTPKEKDLNTVLRVLHAGRSLGLEDIAIVLRSLTSSPDAPTSD